MNYHQPVLLKECLDGLQIKPDGVYVDVTFGGGGHSKAILERLGTNGKLFAFDQDKDAEKNIPADARLTFIPQNFMYMKNFLRMHEATQVDGILADLGVSSHQFDEAERGFSIRFEADLDMRMNQQSKKTAATVLNEYDENQLKHIFRAYGEVENAYKLVKLITDARITQPITTTEQLKTIIAPCTPKFKDHQYLAKVFQALRIEVNNEIDVLKELLTQSLEVLNVGGRLVVMSYHSLEDRLVKNFMKTGNFEGDVIKDFYGNIARPFELITKKPLTPSEEEIDRNSRSRSAKLRVAEKRINK
ncbi:MAG TPA: 16S rRNA (cytosine(1402)-N(4))-methyltransferase RsmH [Bacteroidia bacterium]|nr:16S rRNA (cytosine(1402)-N(4))-methyltransferase RsmH [Bacteroidia bacterium]